MALKFATWNQGRGLSDSPENRSVAALRAIDELDADVLVLPEAYDQHSPAIDGSTWQILSSFYFCMLSGYFHMLLMTCQTCISRGKVIE